MGCGTASPYRGKCALPECQELVKEQVTGRPGHYCSARCANRARKRAERARKKLSVTKQDVSRKVPDILFYCGLNEKWWNHHLVQPGTHVCIAPVTGRVALPGEGGGGQRDTSVLIDPTIVRQVLLDSGAFSDGIELAGGKVVRSHRLSCEDALQRQIGHAYKYRYAALVEALVSYDLLIDETWQDGERKKGRWSVEAADYAVEETVTSTRPIQWNGLPTLTSGLSWLKGRCACFF
jgi:hypothetical protein